MGKKKERMYEIWEERVFSPVKRSPDNEKGAPP